MPILAMGVTLVSKLLLPMHQSVSDPPLASQRKMHGMLSSVMLEAEHEIQLITHYMSVCVGEHLGQHLKFDIHISIIVFEPPGALHGEEYVIPEPS